MINLIIREVGFLKYRLKVKIKISKLRLDLTGKVPKIACRFLFTGPGK